jgi:hypothetical protein
MKVINNMILFLSILILISCDKNDELSVLDSEDLYGCWINPVINDSLSTYEKANSLKDNDYGLAFKSGHVFIERKNSGWCGTPPISYADFDGTWTQTDSIINITVGFWGGSADYQWKIISIDKKKLKIIRLKEEYHFEN